MPLRSTLLAAATVAALATAPAALAQTAPPANDNYLASTALNEAGGAMPPQFADTVDTTAATTQADLFNPSRTGQPLGGAGPENTQCRSTSYGNTVWYDFHPPTAGGVDIKAVGFDAVIAVYEWDDRTAKITRQVACADTTGPSEELQLQSEIKARHAYTVQVGGVTGPAGSAGGPLNFSLEWFPDTDGDSVLDALDKCRRTPGLERFGGCPPDLNIAPSLNFDNAPGGIRINRLVVARVPKGAKVIGRCGGCGSQTIRARRAGTVSLTRLVGRTVRAGSKVQIRVTMGRTGRGKFRFGATGKLVTWPVRPGGIGTKREQCLHVGTGRVEKCS